MDDTTVPTCTLHSLSRALFSVDAPDRPVLALTAEPTHQHERGASAEEGVVSARDDRWVFQAAPLWQPVAPVSQY